MGVIFLSLIDSPQYTFISFVKGLRQLIKILAEVLGEAMLQCIQLAEYPSEPEQQRKKPQITWNSMTFSHSISSFRQRLNHKRFIICSPSPHRRARGRVDNAANIVSNVRLLSAFVM